MPQALLTSTDHASIPLQAVTVNANLNGILAEVSIEQHYLNDCDTNIETVYSFPLPLDAVLLSLEVVINGETLKGHVSAKAAAEQEYEEAIEDGNTAVLLSKVSPGFYSVNLGNLLPYEMAVIRIKYAQLLQWQGEQLRFYFPTTFTPRYGQPLRAGFEPHEQPRHSLVAEYPFSFELLIEGILASARIASSTHSLATAHQQGCTSVNLAENSNLMDRDLVLSISKPDGYIGEALTGNDIDGQVHLASLCPPLINNTSQSGRNLKIVVDCSGSMMGDSIEQAKFAVHQVLLSLTPKDYFNIVLFGSRTKLMFDTMVNASSAQIQLAIKSVTDIYANMGGTEMREALQRSYSLTSMLDARTELLLITDGAVWQAEEITSAAKNSNHRHFIIGVGSSVNEAFLTELARSSKGAAEFVTVNDDMAKRIVRHVNRIDQPCVHSVCIDWPITTTSFPASLPELYLGDTCNSFSWSDGLLTRSPEYFYQFESVVHEFSLPITETKAEESVSTLARIAAYEKLKSLPPEDAAKVSERYQLVTEYTSCVLVKVRTEDKATKLPELQEIPHQMPVGAFGMGRVLNESTSELYSQSLSFEPCSSPEFDDIEEDRRCMAPSSSPSMNELDHLEIPAFLRKISLEETRPQTVEEWLERILKQNDESQFNLDALELNGEYDHVISKLKSIINDGVIDAQTLFFVWLKLRHEFMKDKLSLKARMLIRGHLKKRSIKRVVINQIREAFLERFGTTV
ncbi:VWA domain-containing protein [Parashewanella spongiae]|nr:VIT domain-containing protein [Parashewanella spongiae]MCL1079683.1 VWA domain-containing protein [Parashewanella spongiae]